MRSVLGLFYTLFKAEGQDEVKKANQDVKKSSDDVEKSFKNTNQSTDKLSHAFNRLGHELAGIITSAISVGALFEGLKSAIDYATQIDVASRALQVNVSELDAWGGAVQRTGGNLQSFEGSLNSLAEHLGTTGETAMKVLPQLADSFGRMNLRTALNYGKMLGLDEGTILLLQKGRREVEAIVDRQKELGVVTKQDAETARKFSYEWQDATRSFRSAFMGAAEAILPLMTKVVDFFIVASQYFRKHADLIVGALIAVGVAALFFAAPFILTTVAVFGLIAAFALLYEDIKAFMQGHNSLTADLLKRWPEIGAAIIGTVNLIGQALKTLGPLLIGVFKGALVFIGDVLDGLNLLLKLLVPVVKFLESHPDAAKHWTIESQVNEKDKPKVMSDDEVNAYISKGQAMMATANTTPLNSAPANAFSNTSNNSNRNVSINTGPITIQTQSTDPAGAALAFGDFLSEHFKQTINNFDDGIAI